MTIELDAQVLENIFRFANNAGIQEKLWFSMEDCALAWGFEKTYFHRRKHLLPGFGVFDDPSHKRFSREHFLEWVGIPLCEHERRWGAMTAAQRREISNLRERVA